MRCIKLDFTFIDKPFRKFKCHIIFIQVFSITNASFFSTIMKVRTLLFRIIIILIIIFWIEKSKRI